jgi:hypothetical protein
MHAEVMGNNNNVEKMLSPMPEGERERERGSAPQKRQEKEGASPHMDPRKLGHPLPITSGGGKERQGHKILTASFTSQMPPRVKVQFMIQKIPDNGK